MHFTHAAWMQDLAVFAIDQLAKVGIRMESNGLPLAEALEAWQQQAFTVTTFGHNISFPDPDATSKNVKPNIFHFLEDARLIELFDQQAVEGDLDKPPRARDRNATPDDGDGRGDLHRVAGEFLPRRTASRGDTKAALGSGAVSATTTSGCPTG